MRTSIPVRTALAVCALWLSGTPLAAQGRGAGSDADLVARARANREVQIVAFNSYVKTPAPPSPERAAAIAALRQEFGLPAQGGGRGGFSALTPEQRTAYRERMARLDAQFPPPARATVADFVNHIDYAVKLIGIDHVGISSDFDGGGGVDGWNDASETFNVTLERR